MLPASVGVGGAPASGSHELGATAPLAYTAAAEAIQRAEGLEAQLNDLVRADLEHLRELAVLNRMADALSQRRSHAEVLHEALREAVRVAQARRAWVVEPDASAKPRAAWVADHDGEHCRAVEFSSLPLEARDLCGRALAERPSQPLLMPHYEPDAGDGAFMALPIQSAKHQIGVLIVYGLDQRALTDSHCTRLLQSMLRHTAIGCENARLFEAVSAMIVDVVIAMATAVESRDPYTGGHVMRVTAYSLLLADRAGLDPAAKAILRLGGLLHDIGKVAIPDAILRKPGKLDDAEFEIMKTHAAVGHQIISPVPQLAAVAPVVRWHHERFDGKGYPDGLAGEAIPLLPRIAAIADTFDAMTSDRPYRKGMPIGAAQAEIARCAGAQFDPALARLFVGVDEERFAESAAALRAWRETDRSTELMHLMELLDMNLPRLGA